LTKQTPISKLPFGFWLALPTFLGMVVCVLIPAQWLSSDPTAGISLAIIALSVGGVAQAFVSIFAKSWWRFVGQAWLAQVAMMVAACAYAIAWFSDMGPALMALMMPILFPGMAFGLAGLVRFVICFFRR
jgi:hypothetical protein